MNKRDFPLSLSKDIEKLIKDFRIKTLENLNILEKVDDPDYLLFYRDKADPRFYFSIHTPNQNGEFKSFFHFDYFPKDEKSLQTNASHNDSYEQLLKCFDFWRSIIIQYDEIHLTEDELFRKIYEEEFYSELENLDDDAEINPFEHNQQVFIYNLLKHVEIKIEKSDLDDDEKREIILETNDLKSNIQNLTKKIAVRRLSKLFGMIKKKGLELFLEIIDVAKKELIKKALSSGADEIDFFTNKFL